MTLTVNPLAQVGPSPWLGLKFDCDGRLFLSRFLRILHYGGSRGGRMSGVGVLSRFSQATGQRFPVSGILRNFTSILIGKIRPLGECKYRAGMVD